MFPQRKTRSLFNCGFALVILISLLADASPAQKTAKPKKNETEPQIAITGRVLADVFGLADYLLVGEGFNVKVFILGMEASSKQGTLLTPVKVKYRFFNWQPILPQSFFDYSRRYELMVVRDHSCDETVESLSYVQAADPSGKPIGEDLVLRPLEGAPKELLKHDLRLPCYVLTPGNYKALKESKEQTNPPGTDALTGH